MGESARADGPVEAGGLPPEHHDDYGSRYFENYSELRLDRNEQAPPYRCGEPVWEASFRRIAEEITTRLNPHTALDAGCAIGFLVQALRARDVAAYGVDISDWAISQAPDEIRQFCRVGTLTEELAADYDLITCIEVLEHLPSAEAAEAIGNLCRHTRMVLFSSTPDRFDEVTHINVQTSEYWAELFSGRGFYRDVDFDASFISPHAILFRPIPLQSSVVAAYERWALRSHTELVEVRKHRDLLYSEVWSARQAADAARAEVIAVMNTKSFKITKPIRAIGRAVRRLTR